MSVTDELEKNHYGPFKFVRKVTACPKFLYYMGFVESVEIEEIIVSMRISETKAN